MALIHPCSDPPPQSYPGLGARHLEGKMPWGRAAASELSEVNTRVEGAEMRWGCALPQGLQVCVWVSLGHATKTTQLRLALGPVPFPFVDLVLGRV